MTAIDEDARPAIESDIAVITELATQAIAELTLQRGGPVWARMEARKEPLESGLRRDLNAVDSTVVVGTIDRIVVGYGTIRLAPLHDGSTLGKIDDIYVTPEARGVGVGEAMIEEMLDWARQRKCEGVDSIALPGNRQTKNFFETHGLVARAIIVHRRL